MRGFKGDRPEVRGADLEKHKSDLVLAVSLDCAPPMDSRLWDLDRQIFLDAWLQNRISCVACFFLFSFFFFSPLARIITLRNTRRIPFLGWFSPSFLASFLAYAKIIGCFFPGHARRRIFNQIGMCLRNGCLFRNWFFYMENFQNSREYIYMLFAMLKSIMELRVKKIIYRRWRKFIIIPVASCGSSKRIP